MVEGRKKVERRREVEVEEGESVCLCCCGRRERGTLWWWWEVVLRFSPVEEACWLWGFGQSLCQDRCFSC